MENKLISSNRKAGFHYTITEKFEAGIQLLGSEVKSLRVNSCSLNEGYIIEQNGELYLKKVNIPVFKQANINNHDPRRERKLLFNKSEIRKLIGKTREKGLTLVTMRLYFKNGKVKVELALARGKKVYDKRKDIAKKDFQREQERRIKY